ncbi:MAG: PcfB family protein, partial [Bacilli bacterium]
MTGGETADQAVRMTLQGIEVSANIALKAGGAMTKSLAAMLYAILTDKKKVKGKARLTNMLKSGKELKVFAIRGEDLKLFCQEAKKYGVLYSVLKEKNNADGICDIMVRAEDASKISRIVDKFELATVDTNAIRESILANQSLKEQQPLKDVAPLNDKEHDDLVNMLMSSVKEEQNIENPSLARTKNQS